MALTVVGGTPETYKLLWIGQSLYLNQTQKPTNLSEIKLNWVNEWKFLHSDVKELYKIIVWYSQLFSLNGIF